MIRTFFIFLSVFHITISCSQRVSSQNNQQSDTSPTSTDLQASIVDETKEGGKYDFFSPIKGQEYDGIQIKPGVYDTKIGMALYKWGKANYEAGVKSLDEVYANYSAYKGRAANEIEKTYLKMGYGRELEN